METVIASCLIFLGASVVLLALSALGLWVLDWFNHRVIIPWVVRIEQAEYDRLRRLLRQDACWFHEDPPTMALLHEIASTSYEVSRARENWRKARRPTKGDE
ncbi:MAG: hypothetical protein IT181_13060 [Acidobacteria bacterium]|nr:hypothetical protein [Acidobacteriota bacterium]